MVEFNHLNQKGQSSIEGAVMALICSTFIALVFGTVYLLYSSYWLEHIMYESLICQQERGQTQYCIAQAKDRIHSVLFLKDAFTFHMVTGESSCRVSVKMKVDPPFLKSKIISFSKVLKI